MSDLPHLWAAYARLQHKLSSKACVDDRAWGFEAGLNVILASDPESEQLTQNDIDHAVANGARQDRYRAKLRAIYLLQGEESGDSNANLQAIEARQNLELIKNSVKTLDWVLLCEVAAGHEYAEISAKQGTTAGNLRARVLRLRRSLVQVCTWSPLGARRPRRGAYAVGRHSLRKARKPQ